MFNMCCVVRLCSNEKKSVCMYFSVIKKINNNNQFEIYSFSPGFRWTNTALFYFIIILFSFFLWKNCIWMNILKSCNLKNRKCHIAKQWHCTAPPYLALKTAKTPENTHVPRRPRDRAALIHIQNNPFNLHSSKL